jgi:hypothetical protein
MIRDSINTNYMSIYTPYQEMYNSKDVLGYAEYIISNTLYPPITALGERSYKLRSKPSAKLC